MQESIHEAAFQGNITQLEHFLQQDPKNINILNENGLSGWST
jgi:hypothetical protein